MFNEILIALKFSKAGLAAFRKAVGLAEIHGARLHVFHALDYRLQDLPDADPKLKAAMQEIGRRIDTELKPLMGSLKRVAFEYFPADPALEVCRMANTIRADLILLGCHEPSRKISLGRVDYVGMTILDKAPCPVMLVPAPAEK
jgi:nucleotide-binding universal stress UspA family protein